eukprot:scaffold34626_cov206-Amphora_coffeaeformis.AAC.1
MTGPEAAASIQSPNPDLTVLIIFPPGFDFMWPPMGLSKIRPDEASSSAWWSLHTTVLFFSTPVRQ